MKKNMHSFQNPLPSSVSSVPFVSRDLVVLRKDIFHINEGWSGSATACATPTRSQPNTPVSCKYIHNYSVFRTNLFFCQPLTSSEVGSSWRMSFREKWMQRKGQDEQFGHHEALCHQLQSCPLCTDRMEVECHSDSSPYTRWLLNLNIF